MLVITKQSYLPPDTALDGLWVVVGTAKSLVWALSWVTRRARFGFTGDQLDEPLNSLRSWAVWPVCSSNSMIRAITTKSNTWKMATFVIFRIVKNDVPPRRQCGLLVDKWSSDGILDSVNWHLAAFKSRAFGCARVLTSWLVLILL